MRFTFKNSEKINFGCLEDLAIVIPENMQGKPLNFGQGEGQVEIEATVWGFYVNSNHQYYMVYEKGIEDWDSIQILASSIVNRISTKFNLDANLVVEGALNYENNV